MRVGVVHFGRRSKGVPTKPSDRASLLIPEPIRLQLSEHVLCNLGALFRWRGFDFFLQRRHVVSELPNLSATIRREERTAAAELRDCRLDAVDEPADLWADPALDFRLLPGLLSRDFGLLSLAFCLCPHRPRIQARNVQPSPSHLLLRHVRLSPRDGFLRPQRTEFQGRFA